MKPTTVTPESMAAAGSSLSQLGDEMSTGLNSLLSTIQGDGDPWGADEQGSMFGQVYRLVLGKAFQSVASHVQQVQYAGQALTAQAGGYDTVETGNTQQLTTLASGLE